VSPIIATAIGTAKKAVESSTVFASLPPDRTIPALDSGAAPAVIWSRIGDLRYFPPRRPEEAAAVTDTTAPRTVDPSLVSYTHWMYALHAASALLGVITSAAIATAFVFSIPSIIAVIMNYVRRDDARGTWLDSHFGWQLRTFWYAALWIVLIFLFSSPLVLLLGLGFLTMWIGIAIVGVWILYRVIRGWLALKDGRTI
jgi:uncharacterized membrane protein